LALFCFLHRAIVLLTGLQNVPNIKRLVRQKFLARCDKYFFSRQYRLRVFSEDVPTDRKSSTFDHSRPHPEFSDSPRQKYLGRLCNLTVVHFNPQKKRVFTLVKYSPSPQSMFGYITEQLRTQTLKFCSIIGRGGGKKVKSSSLPNTFDDDCRFLFKMTLNIAASMFNRW